MTDLLLALAAIVPSGQPFVCTPVRVWDGDGPIWCAEGPRVRLAGIAAREMDGTCRRYQPCPAVSAARARDTLVALLGGRRGATPDGHILVRFGSLRCLSEGDADGGRTAAWCQTPAGVDLSCAMVESGTALRWPRYDPGRRLERCRTHQKGPTSAIAD